MKPCPTTIPLACTHGKDGDADLKRHCCGIHRLPILSALSRSKAVQEVVEVMVWDNLIRQWEKKRKTEYSERVGSERHDGQSSSYLFLQAFGGLYSALPGDLLDAAHTVNRLYTTSR